MRRRGCTGQSFLWNVDEPTMNGRNVQGKPDRTRRGRPWGRWLAGVGIAVLMVYLAPRLLLWGPVLNGLVARFGDLEPLRVEVGGARGGWLAGLQFEEVRVYDGENRLLCSVANVITGKGMLGWAMDQQDLGTLRFVHPEVVVAVGKGTTNLEDALHPVWARWSLAAAQADVPAATGTIEIEQARVLVVDANSQPSSRQWLLDLETVRFGLPDADSPWGDLDGQARLWELQSDASGWASMQPTGSAGTVAFRIDPIEDGRVVLRAKLVQVPLGIYSSVHRRLPDLPLDGLEGSLSATVAGWYRSVDAWRIALTNVQAAGLRCDAVSVLGPGGLESDLITLAVDVGAKDGGLVVHDGRVVCEFLDAEIVGRAPWPLVPFGPSATIPGDLRLQAAGSIDLPRFVQSAPGIIPLRQGLEMEAGKVTYRVDIRPDAAGRSSVELACSLPELKGRFGGQSLQWKDPLSLQLKVEAEPGGDYAAQVNAQTDFANLTAGGTQRSGAAHGTIDLDRLYDRISRWVELPVQTLSGTVKLDGTWKTPAERRIQAAIDLETTPLRISTAAGNTIEEPAWTGQVEAVCEVDAEGVRRIEQARLDLVAAEERWALELAEPLVIRGSETVGARAAFLLDVHTDLERCHRRGAVWMSSPPILAARGRLALAASGQIGLEGASVRSANWNCENLYLAGEQFQFQEPHVIGKFNGRVDSDDFSQLIVELLQVQSSSFSVVAQDSAEQDGARSGRGRFRVDLGRLATSAALGDPARCIGLVDGNVAWRIGPAACAFSVQLDGKQIAIATSQGRPENTQMWTEPSVQVQASGAYEFDAGAARLDRLSFVLPWGQLDGTLHWGPIRNAPDGMETKFSGQVSYDAERLAGKLAPMTGNLLRLTGTHTSPVEIRWKQGGGAAMAGLSVDQLTVGWRSANLAGVQVGEAEVPVRVQEGVLTAASEIPISGGAARFDITSDLKADSPTIVQQPQTVLENVQITDEMSASWLKYVAPLVAEATRVDGRLSLRLDEAVLVPGTPQAHRLRGVLTIHKASVGPGPLANQFILLSRQLDALRKQQLAQAIAPQQQVWVDLPEQNIRFAMSDGRVTHDNLNVRIGDVTLRTTGTVALDGSLAMRAFVPIPDNWVDKSPWLAGLRGQTLEFPVSGTLWQPGIDARLLADLGQQTIRSAAAGALQQGLQRGLGKLLGEEGILPLPGAAPQDGTAPGVQRTNPLKELGEQLLRTPSLFPSILPGGQNPTGGGTGN